MNSYENNEYNEFSTNKRIWRSQVTENAVRPVKLVDHCPNPSLSTIAEAPLMSAEGEGAHGVRPVKEGGVRSRSWAGEHCREE